MLKKKGSVNLSMKTNFLCPCHSKKKYEECCRRYHLGKLADNALDLMRSRYSAYALKLADYIIATTHPKNAQYFDDKEKWRKEILQFANSTDFENLKILDFIKGEEESIVTFTAYLKRGNLDITFTERSYFEKMGEKWLYKKGEILSEKAID